MAKKHVHSFTVAVDGEELAFSLDPTKDVNLTDTQFRAVIDLIATGVSRSQSGRDSTLICTIHCSQINNRERMLVPLEAGSLKMFVGLLGGERNFSAFLLKQLLEAGDIVVNVGNVIKKLVGDLANALNNPFQGNSRFGHN